MSAGEKCKYFGWHILPDDCRLTHDDGRKVKIGRVLHVEPPIKVCERGLHVCSRPIDTLEYAKGNTFCYVECWGDFDVACSKAAFEYRKVLWMANCEDMLWHFACDIAEYSLDIIANPYLNKYYEMIERKRNYLIFGGEKHGFYDRDFLSSYELWNLLDVIKEFVLYRPAYQVTSRVVAIVHDSMYLTKAEMNDRLGAMLVAKMRREGLVVVPRKRQDYACF